MSQTNSAQNPEQQLKIDSLHTSFQQLCFAYGALAFDKNRFNKDKYKWFAEDCRALADSALEIHQLNGDV